jgi:hypothetical protein
MAQVVEHLLVALSSVPSTTPKTKQTKKPDFLGSHGKLVPYFSFPTSTSRYVYCIAPHLLRNSPQMQSDVT